MSLSPLQRLIHALFDGLKNKINYQIVYASHWARRTPSLACLHVLMFVLMFFSLLRSRFFFLDVTQRYTQILSNAVSINRCFLTSTDSDTQMVIIEWLQ